MSSEGSTTSTPTFIQRSRKIGKNAMQSASKNKYKILIITSAVIFGAAIIVAIVLLIVFLVQVNNPQTAAVTTNIVSSSNVAAMKNMPMMYSPEVFYYNVGEQYNFSTVEEARRTVAKMGFQLASKEQLISAYNSGANWCAVGYINNGEVALPIQEDTLDCEGSTGLVFIGDAKKAGAICWGPKPIAGTNGVYPFSRTKWSFYDV